MIYLIILSTFLYIAVVCLLSAFLLLAINGYIKGVKVEEEILNNAPSFVKDMKIKQMCLVMFFVLPFSLILSPILFLKKK